ncbi:unnamed protein product [Durusdinium trenchii]|uniref:K Homology domain-containing protein n=1 Tax=Durusdinium trenchii TaxID=1381693 RepID=A0ABP0JB55_9DINO
MNFPVPWRCLLPHEAVDFVTYNNHEILTDLSNKTGAMIDVSGDRDTPKRLSDRIITISGQANQKEGACLGIVEKLRKLQDLLDSEVGFFVIIVPATAIPVIVGIKGATIAEVLAGTGVEVSIGKENVMGMPDTPIGLEGTASQVTTAVANIHKVIQDMADRGRLLPADFKYRPDKAAAQLAAGAGAHLPEVHLPPADHDLFYGMDPTQNFRTKAKIVVDTGLAGGAKESATNSARSADSASFLPSLRWTCGEASGLHFEGGGMGAQSDRDGLSSTIFPCGFQSIPLEIAEMSDVFLFNCKELITDSGGAGRFRGGLGVRWELIARQKTHAAAIQGSDPSGPLGREGGCAGRPFFMQIKRKQETCFC